MYISLHITDSVHTVGIQKNFLFPFHFFYVSAVPFYPFTAAKPF